MKKLIILSALLIAGCTTEPVKKEQTNNIHITVDLLFVHDGVKVYRFQDAGQSHYYVIPYRGPLETVSIESCGKNCTRSVEIPTMRD